MSNLTKTGYEWSLDANIRILDLRDYVLPIYYANCSTGSTEDDYFTVNITNTDFINVIKGCAVKPNSTPRKTLKHLDYRMYGLVPYNLSAIQSGIQFGHAVVEYQQESRYDKSLELVYNKWASKDKTFIILNGGTTNDNYTSKHLGTLQQHRDMLKSNKVSFSTFREPDLNEALTAVVFLVDERVWDRELYPDYVDLPKPWANKGRYKPKETELSKYEVENLKNREQWVTKIGGPKNDWLRTWLRNFRLAN